MLNYLGGIIRAELSGRWARGVASRPCKCREKAAAASDLTQFCVHPLPSVSSVQRCACGPSVPPAGSASPSVPALITEQLEVAVENCTPSPCLLQHGSRCARPRCRSRPRRGPPGPQSPPPRPRRPLRRARRQPWRWRRHPKPPAQPWVGLCSWCTRPALCFGGLPWSAHVGWALCMLSSRHSSRLS